MHESVDLLCYVCDVSACTDRQLAIATTPLNQIILFIVIQEYPKYYIITHTQIIIKQYIVHVQIILGASLLINSLM